MTWELIHGDARDYLRLRSKVLDRTGIPNPAPPAIDGQASLFETGPQAKEHTP